MTAFFSLFKDSANELKTVRCLTITGIFVAISMVLETFTIEIPYAKINFAFLAIAVIGMLFGPTVCLIAGAMCDIVGFIVHPAGGFLFIYILIAMLQGLIYGLLLYKKSGKQVMIFAVVARLLDVLIINLCLKSFISFLSYNLNINKKRGIKC